ncbi:MAG: DUF5689 domain-containing protein [Chitinophagales bacterium]
MKRFLFYLTLFLTFTSLKAQEISIADARAKALESVVTVKGIVTTDGQFGGTRYVQDATAGIATFNTEFAAAAKSGDEVVITGPLSEFNNLLQISGDGFTYEIVSSGNDLPEAKTLTASEGYSEAYEGQLVRFEGVLFPEAGTFPAGSTNYAVTIGGSMDTYALRVDGRTDIGGAEIPTEAIAAVGIMAQFQDTYQLLPRSLDDLGLAPVMSDLITIAEARTKATETIVTVKGIITSGSEFGGVRYIQDATAGIAVFNNALAAAVSLGDEVEITGGLTEFNNLLQIGSGVTFEILSSGNALPTPKTLAANDGFSEAYEGQLVRFEAVTFPETGVFADNSTNYDVTIGGSMDTYALRVDGRTDIGGTSIPEEPIAVVGIMSQFQDLYQFLPRSLADLGGMTGGNDLITIAEARTKAVETVVTVKGIITSGSEFGGVRYIQDATAGLAVFSNDLAAAVSLGDEVEITGGLTEFNNLLQIGSDVTFEILSSGNDLPEPKTLAANDGFSEAYEGQLVRFEAVTFPETGVFADNSTNYDVTIGGSMDTYALRVDGRTDIGGTPIPEEPIAAVGIMSQFQDTYQLLPRSLADLGEENTGGAITIAEARAMELGSVVTVEGIITSGAEFGGTRYMQDATAGIATFNTDFAAVAMSGDKVRITGPLSVFNNLLQISGDGFAFEILSSGNDLPEPKTLTASEGYSIQYESQLVRFEGVKFPEAGVFPSNSTNYDVTIGGTMDTYALRVDGRTDIKGAAIPEDAIAAVGIMGLFQETYQLLPRSRADLGIGGNTGGGVITIAEARTQLAGATVTVQGTVTNGAEFGAIRYFQDETAGIAVFATGGVLDNVILGDIIKVKGQLSEFNNLLEITDGGDFSVEVISSGNMLPEPVTGLLPAQGYKEDYEGQLIRFDNVKFFSTGNFAAGSSNYQLVSGLGLYEVRINAGTDIAGTPIPQGVINITGILGQFQDTYQLLPRSLQDFEYLGNPPVFASQLTQNNMTTTSFEVNFETLNNGTTSISYGLTEALELGEIVNDGNFVTNHTATLEGLEAGQIYYVQATSVGETGDVSTSSVQAFATVSLSTGHIEAFFNRKVDTSVSTGRDALFLPFGIADTLIYYINNAKYTVDVTSYTMDTSNGILDAIIAAHNRGVVVRLVTDADASPGAYNLFPGQKIRRPAPAAGEIGGIQHNKFIIIDADSPDPNEPLLWTGGTNLSDDQLNVDPNNVIIFQDQSLARAYKIEFEEMLSGKFGDKKRHNTPNEFLIGGKRVELFFTPSEDPQDKLIETVRSADYELYFEILSFTLNNVAYAILDEHNEGTYVAGIFDDDFNPFGEGSNYPYGILFDGLGNDQILQDNLSYIFHHKTLIVDQGHPESDALVWTGSFNWSNSARFRNDENVVVVHDATIANLHYQEFSQRFQELGGTLMVGIDDVMAVKWTTLLYPNPAKGEVTLQFSADQPTDAIIRIQNMAGQVVYANSIKNAQNEKLSIDLQDLPNGMYILSVNNQAEKFVVNK